MGRDDSDALDLPLLFVVEAAGFSPRDVRMLERRESGRKTAAHRSYSLQSKKDLARRYLLSSLASSAASSGSVLDVYMGDVYLPSAGSGCSSSSSVSGRALSSSAALW